MPPLELTALLIVTIFSTPSLAALMASVLIDPGLLEGVFDRGFLFGALP